jgi:hypothetical protein
MMLQVGQLVRVNLAGLQAEGVMFQAAVADAVGPIVKRTSADPAKYLVKLLFSFRGVTEVEVSYRAHPPRQITGSWRKSELGFDFSLPFVLFLFSYYNVHVER